MTETAHTEVIPESPEVVKGGPLDPTSQEGTPPEGHTTGVQAVISDSVLTPEAPLHRGLTGDIKSTQDLLSYTKRLEDLFAQSAATQKANAYQPVQPVVPAVPAGPTAKDKFSELIYSKPDEAFELTLQEAERRVESRRAAADEAKRQEGMFWSGFYEKNADLKRLDHVVQSVVLGKRAEIAALPDGKSVEEFLSRESRKIIDLVKKESGYTETKVTSGVAVTLGASGEPVPQPPRQPTTPLNFAEQIRKLRPHGKK